MRAFFRSIYSVILISFHIINVKFLPFSFIDIVGNVDKNRFFTIFIKKIFKNILFRFYELCNVK